MFVQHGVDLLSGYDMVTKAINLIREHIVDSEELYKKHMSEWVLLYKKWRLKADLNMICDKKSCDKLEDTLHEITVTQSLLRKHHLELMRFYHHSIQQWITLKLTISENLFVGPTYSVDSLDVGNLFQDAVI